MGQVISRAVVLFFSVVSVSFGQSNYAVVTGAVKDPQHLPVSAASLLVSLPTVKQRQAGIPQMNLNNWGAGAFVEDTWQITPATTINAGVRYEYSSPLYDSIYTNTNLLSRAVRLPCS